MASPHLHLQTDQLYPFDARGIAKRFRHSAIFGAHDALRPGVRSSSISSRKRPDRRGLTRRQS
jgi:uncharacterized protein (DUF2249 family)